MGRSFPRDLTAIFQFPRRPGRMLANDLVFSIMQLRVGRLECPAELAVRRGLAGIDLRSRRMRQQNNFLARGSLIASGTSGGSSFWGESFCVESLAWAPVNGVPRMSTTRASIVGAARESLRMRPIVAG